MFKVAQIQDEKKKALATEYVPICRKFFREPQAATVPPTEPQAATVQPTEPPAVAAPQSRRRRDHHHEHAEHHGGHTLEDYFKTHLSWLNDAQREQIRTAKAAGATRAELQNKVKQFYSELAGDDQEKAKSQLQEGCRELIRTVFGQEKANELKQMRESGTPVVEVAKKLEEMVTNFGRKFTVKL
jgi:hypothetical protein